MLITEDQFFHQACEKRRGGGISCVDVFIFLLFFFKLKYYSVAIRRCKDTAVKIKGNHTLELTIGRN